jgi:tetratricopeptide (TPR) repeat protein
VTLAGCSCLTSSAASADEPKPLTVSEDKKAEALVRYEEGTKHYRLAEYDEAIAAFREAYLLVEAPEFLYDIAQSYRLKGPRFCGQARQFYRSYLSVAPTTPKRPAVTAAIADMDDCVRTTQQSPWAEAVPRPLSPQKEPERAPAAEPHRRAPGLATWIAGGTGVAFLAAGGALLISYQLDYTSLRDSGCAPNCDSSTVDGLRDRRAAGFVLLVAGGAAVGTAIILWIAGNPPASKTAAFVRPAIGGLQTGFRF